MLNQAPKFSVKEVNLESDVDFLATVWVIVVSMKIWHFPGFCCLPLAGAVCVQRATMLCVWASSVREMLQHLK